MPLGDAVHIVRVFDEIGATEFLGLLGERCLLGAQRLEVLVVDRALLRGQFGEIGRVLSGVVQLLAHLRGFDLPGHRADGVAHLGAIGHGRLAQHLEIVGQRLGRA